MRVILSLALLARLAAPAEAVTLTVDRLSDVADSADGLCSLREALTAASANAASGPGAGECHTGSAAEPDTIQVVVLGTLILTADLLEATGSTTIAGPGGGGFVIDGGQAYRALAFSADTPEVFVVHAVTVREALSDYGGGIRLGGTSGSAGSFYSSPSLPLECPPSGRHADRLRRLS